jgi:phosphopantothenoylcysteine decarboxylase/phosphopantothenate--cysteine ligase
MGHIQLSRAADLVVVATATADLLARMAQGRADDLASTLLLATDRRILVAPAMNLRMWLHPATQRNVAQLRADGVLFAGPEEGSMACGEWGPGRLAEPETIVAAIEAALAKDTHIPLPDAWNTRLAGRRVLITSGPTREAIDPVRYLSNHSSGRQGHALAIAAAAAGAQVTLVSGPVDLPDPSGVHTLHVTSAREMLAAVEASLPADLFIATAAVADWRVDEAQTDKVKKGAGGPPVLTLVENPDILAHVAALKDRRPALVVGFAAETSNVIAHATAKRARKGCDLIVANDVGPGTQVMGGTQNQVHIITATGVDSLPQVESWPVMDKSAVARALIHHCALILGES